MTQQVAYMETSHFLSCFNIQTKLRQGQHCFVLYFILLKLTSNSYNVGYWEEKEKEELEI